MSLMLAFSMLFGSTSVFATDSTTTTGFTGGSLTFTPEALTLPSGTISSKGTVVVLENYVNHYVLDDRGSADGWTLSVSSSPIVSAAVPDRTAGDGDTFKVSIPADRISVAFWSAYRNNDHGMEEDPVHGPISALTVSEQPLGSSPVTVVKSEPGYGMGEYIVNLNFLFRAPKTGVVHEISDPAESDYTVGQVIGLVAATYTATFTYTLSSGL